MLARSEQTSPARIERAKSAAVEVREQLVGIKVGIGSLTDRVLPHLFPSANEDVFRATIEQSIGIDRPPPQERLSANGTTLEALGPVATRRFFSPTVEHRLLVVVTDGETRPLNEGAVAATLARPPGIETVFVHVWAPNERVFVRGIAAPDYKPDPTSRASLDVARAAPPAAPTTPRTRSEPPRGRSGGASAPAPRSSSGTAGSGSRSRPLPRWRPFCLWGCCWAAQAADFRPLTNHSARRHTHRPALTDDVEEALRIWHVCGLEGG